MPWEIPGELTALLGGRNFGTEYFSREELVICILESLMYFLFWTINDTP